MAIGSFMLNESAAIVVLSVGKKREKARYSKSQRSWVLKRSIYSRVLEAIWSMCLSVQAYYPGLLMVRTEDIIGVGQPRYAYGVLSASRGMVVHH